MQKTNQVKPPRFAKNSFIQSLIAGGRRQTVPVLSAPGARMLGYNLDEVYRCGALQYACIKALSGSYPLAALVTFMDLSVEAEAFGCNILYSDSEAPAVSCPAVSGAGDIERLAVPEVGAARTVEALECARLCAARLDKPTFGGMIGPFSLAGRLMDMTEFMLLAASEPELAHALLAKSAAFLKAYALAIKASGVAGLLIAEPAAGLISPDMCREFSMSYLQDIIGAVKADDFAVILHNCGRTERQVEAMLWARPDALHVGNAVDILDILPQVPANVPVMGNLDPVAVLGNATPAVVHTRTMELLERTAAFPNFTLSSGCDVPADTPPANLAAHFQALVAYNERFD